MSHPFRQRNLGGMLLREFKESVDSEDLVWHRDHHDREVSVISGDGWQLQMENALPIPLKRNKIYKIPAKQYHRLIKGKGDLYLLIKEHVD